MQSLLLLRPRWACSLQLLSPCKSCSPALTSFTRSAATARLRSTFRWVACAWKIQFHGISLFGRFDGKFGWVECVMIFHFCRALGGVLYKCKIRTCTLKQDVDCIRWRSIARALLSRSNSTTRSTSTIASAPAISTADCTSSAITCVSSVYDRCSNI